MRRVAAIPSCDDFALRDDSFIARTVRVPGAFEMSSVAKTNGFEEVALVDTDFVKRNPVDRLPVGIQLVVVGKNAAHPDGFSGNTNSYDVHVRPSAQL